MITPQAPLDAYRTDLAQAPGLQAFGPDDGLWLLAAELLDRWARAARAARRPSARGAEMPDVVPARRALEILLADFARNGDRERSRSAVPTAPSVSDDEETFASQ